MKLKYSQVLLEDRQKSVQSDFIKNEQFQNGGNFSLRKFFIFLKNYFAPLRSLVYAKDVLLINISSPITHCIS